MHPRSIVSLGGVRPNIRDGRIAGTAAAAAALRMKLLREMDFPSIDLAMSYSSG